MTQFYIGVKQVMAWPAEKDGIEGYAVKYPDGYTSWSPKEVFEQAYLPMGESNDGSKITQEMVDDFIASDVPLDTVRLGNHTISRITLRNGFSLVESSACVSTKNYDEKIGESLNIKSAEKKVWNLLGFLLATARNGIKQNG